LSWWGWVIVGASVAAGAVAVAWAALRGDSTAARKAAIDMMQRWHAADVEAKRAKLDRLSSDFDSNAIRIAKLNNALASKRAALTRTYVDAGLSAVEISERFSRIDL
jgi:hypothetical protein